MAEIDIDIEYLKVNKLAYTFEGLTSSNDDSLRQTAEDVALQALEIMNKYQSLHPSYESMINHIKQRNTTFTEEWALSVENNSKSLINQFTDELHNQLQDVDKSVILENIRKLSSIYTIQGNFQQVVNMFNQFHSIIQFQSQPNDVNLFIKNRYIEFNFIQYTTNLYDLIFFPLKKESSSWIGNSYENRIKGVNTYFKKADVYYNKNEMLVNIDNSNKEIQYFWLMNWFGLIVLFKQGKFDEFLSEFNKLISIDSILKPIDVLNNDETGLKTEILIMFKISILITKPFKMLSLLNYRFNDDETSDNEMLFELFDNSSKFEFTIHKIFLDLAESNFKLFKLKFDDTILRCKLISTLGYTFTRDPLSFIQFIDHVVNFKNFLLIISITKRIPKSTMMKLLGCSNDSTNDLILFMTTLRLGELGIGFDYNNDFFYNSGIKSNNLGEQITNLDNRLTGESIANLIKGCLIEQTLNA